MINEFLKLNQGLSVTHIGFNDSETNVAFNEFYLHAKSKGLSVKFWALQSTDQFHSANNNIIEFILGSLRIKSQSSIYHFHFIQLCWLFAAVMKLVRNPARVILTIHTSAENLGKYSRNVFLPWSIFLGVKIVFCSRSSKESFQDTWLWRHLLNSPVVINGWIPKIRTQGIKKNAGVISIGRFISLKNPYAVAQAMSNIKKNDLKFVWIGRGPLQEEIKAQFTKDERFHFLNAVSRERTHESLRDAEIFLSMSKIEGMPISVLEAAGLGCLLVLSDIPPHREIAAKIPNCKLCKSVQEATAAIDKFLLLPQETRRRLQEANSNAAMKHFHFDETLQQYQKIYFEMLK